MLLCRPEFWKHTAPPPRLPWLAMRLMSPTHDQVLEDGDVMPHLEWSAVYFHVMPAIVTYSTFSTWYLAVQLDGSGEPEPWRQVSTSMADCRLGAMSSSHTS